MAEHLDADYYASRSAEWLAEFDAEAEHLRPVLARAYGEGEADAVLLNTRQRFVDLLPRLPYLGGDENPLSGDLVRSAHCLALYGAMRARGKSAAETGKVLWDATPGLVSEAGPRPQQLSTEELMRRRRERAARSQRRQYPDDWVFSFVPGDGVAFDYGYDFTECAALKLYHAHGADEFLPYYCFLDFAVSRAAGLGLHRTMTLAEGHPMCNHRFTRDRQTAQDWPPPWLHQPEPAAGPRLTLSVLPHAFAVCRLGPADPIPPWLSSCSLWSVTRTAEELSVVACEEAVPAACQAEKGWRCLKVQGPLDLALVGVLAALSGPLADAGISIFALSTYDTDYLLVRAADLDRAKAVLTASGHSVVQ